MHGGMPAGGSPQTRRSCTASHKPVEWTTSALAPAISSTQLLVRYRHGLHTSSISWMVESLSSAGAVRVTFGWRVEGIAEEHEQQCGYESGGGWKNVGDMTEGGDSGYMLVGLQFRVCIFARSWGDYMRTPNSRVFVAIEER